ncbi:MAG: UDP-N-acetylmuramoyl-L-alanyl-D-glutamate--L-lysine ligase, partial [Lactococcus lactis]
LDFELDRELAIKKAVSKTKSTDDAVIIAGKGTDMFQLKDGKRQPYIGDTAAAQKYL